MNDKLSIKEICAEFELSPVYVRRAISRGDLKVAERRMIAKNTEKIFVARAEVEAWRAKAGAHSPREDGRSKFVLYATSDELAEIEKLLEEANLEAIIKRANPAKE